MSEKVKPIFVMRPGVGMDAIRARVESAGYLFIEGDPDDFRVIEVVPITPTAVDAIMRSALGAIKNATFSSVQSDFGARLAKALTEPAPTPPKAKSRPKKRQAVR